MIPVSRRADKSVEKDQRTISIEKLSMATINETSAPARQRAGVARMKKNNLRIDMTPMVDLGFLLVAFFVMTTELSKPSVTRLNMPKEGPPSHLGESAAFTILIDGDNRIAYYHGPADKVLKEKLAKQSSFSPRRGVGDAIRTLQKWLDEPGVFKEGRAGLMLLIKPTANASYSQVINAMDEALINKVEKYMILSPDETDKEILRLVVGDR
jgi:biopolymer transport protein ExbD